MNLGQILTAQEELGYGTDTQTARTSMTNSCARRVYALRRWPFLKVLGATGPVLVAGTESYDVSAILTDLQYIDGISLDHATGTDYDLEYLDNEAFRELRRVDATRETPLWWTATGKTVYLYPTPNAVFTIKVDYLQKPAALVSAGDVPALPEEYHDILVWGGLVEMTFRERDYNGHQFAQQEYDKRLLEMMHQYGMVQRQTSSRVVKSGQHTPFDFAEDAAGWL